VSGCFIGAEQKLQIYVEMDSSKFGFPNDCSHGGCMFLPTTRQEMAALGWKQLDVILVSGDTYIDSPFMGIAIIGNLLVDAGFRVGIIAQPEIATGNDIKRLGEPLLFWGVSGGCVDSMVANYTASGKRRKSDDFTPGGKNDRRPDRAVIVYSNLIRRYFKKTAPIVLGGIEASLRRIAHYDFWSDRVRRSILLDAKADFLLYGMSDRSVLELAASLQARENPIHTRGLCYMAEAPEISAADIILPFYEAVVKDPQAFTEMFHLFYDNNDSISARRLLQKYDKRYLVHNPPQYLLSEMELDKIYGLDYQRDAHPFYARQGMIKALETIRFSITTHRGCYGECNFCAIAVHQGRTIQSRSQESIVAEAKELTRHPEFRGIIQDVGGATANMYGIECRLKPERGSCRGKRCLVPVICKKLPVNHREQRRLLEALRRIEGIRHIFVASGIRYDMILHDEKEGEKYLMDLVSYHVSGQMKVAPEHCQPEILALMGKPDQQRLVIQFRKLFKRFTKEAGKKQFLTYYFIAAHPGCRTADMEKLRQFARDRLQLSPEQVQIFTPTPSTYSTLMYYTGKDPFSGRVLFVERNSVEKELQKEVMMKKKMVTRKKTNEW
jgi:uncharacterized radical SAM protein YgiQ